MNRNKRAAKAEDEQKATPAFELHIYHGEALLRELRKIYNNNGESLWHCCTYTLRVLYIVSIARL